MIILSLECVLIDAILNYKYFGYKGTYLYEKIDNSTN